MNMNSPPDRPWDQSSSLLPLSDIKASSESLSAFMIAAASHHDLPSTVALSAGVGTVRITADDHAITCILWPRLLPLLREHPGIQLELSADYALTDIAAQRFEAGVRIGSEVDRDMIAVRIGPDFRMAVVATPAYLAGKPLPATPQDLIAHRCINLRLPTHGGLYAWDFEQEGQALNVRVQGQVIFNNTFAMLQAALDGLGIAYVPWGLAQPHVEAGRLQPLLRDWWPLFPGYHLYYANRRQLSPALAEVINVLRYRG